ncbi:PAP 25A-associated domain-containing protein, putative [Babesia caballi]|uniref:PAP 25A-associated domain-containing protein, putative n=1 Tax=Babesia caballi TaxID=5871 RepID=A0AAV4LV69_BABCB|nr:PAP 25A-associated domain-containing protein, putative [Babesia caballi]
MDWLRSALNDDVSGSESSDEDTVPESRQKRVSAPSVLGEAATLKQGTGGVNGGVSLAELPKAGAETSQSVEGDEDGADAPTSSLSSTPLFSLATTPRKAEDFTKAEQVRINPPKPSGDELPHPHAAADALAETSQSTGEDMTVAMPQRDQPGAGPKGALDTLEIMQCFNMMHSGANIKAPKQRDWFGSDIRVTEINADDLRMSKVYVGGIVLAQFLCLCSEKSARYSTSKQAMLEGGTAFTAPARRLETDDGHVLTTNVMRKTSKRKHQISWLAADAQERELELLERSAQARKTKHETQMKYGW